MAQYTPRSTHLICVLEGVHTRQARSVRHKAALKQHVSILNTAQRDLVVDLGWGEARSTFFHNERIHLHTKREKWYVVEEVTKQSTA